MSRPPAPPSWLSRLAKTCSLRRARCASLCPITRSERRGDSRIPKNAGDSPRILGNAAMRGSGLVRRRDAWRGELGPTGMHFLPIDPHRFGRLNAEAHPITLHGDHDDTDVPINDDLFSTSTREDKHSEPSLANGERRESRVGWERFRANLLFNWT